VRRRAFLGGLAGAAAWPLAVRAQRTAAMRHIGVLTPLAEGDPVGRARIAAFQEGLRELGWIEGHNLRTEYRWAGGNPGDARKYATEFATLNPEIILTGGSVLVAPLLQATRTIPIVFVHVPDPVGAGFVDSLARPGGNATGFVQFEYGLGAKWLELLKQIAPNITRTAILRDPAITAGIGQFGAIQSAAPSLGVEVSPVNLRGDDSELDRAITAFAGNGNGGLILTGSALSVVHRDLIITLAARNKLPALYFERFFVRAGGLISYGPDLVDQYRQAAKYVDRVLKGENPADMPVLAPTKYEMAINLKTAKALGLTVPQALLAQADEVIE
jgi:putative ABC transport system substrate-binding protein